MLGVVRDRMVALDLLPPHGQVHCNVFVKLDNILVDMFDDSGRYYYVRLAEVYDLEAEHRIARDVAGHLGEFVPRPLAFFREQGLSCIVFEGVDFDVVSGKDLLAASPTGALGRGLLEFLDGGVRRLRSGAHPVDLGQVLAYVDERFLETEHEALWHDVRRGLDLPYLASLPSQRQHGDFVPNNFGLRPAGLVVFDWEDFGKISLPGFDLAVLLSSIVDFEPDALCEMRAARRGSGPGGVAWVAPALQILGIDADEFWRSVPFHLFLFLCLKDRYSPAIRAKVVRAIQGLL